MYSSGSTGQPQPQPKLWGSLVRNAAAEVQRLAEAAPDGIALLGTVPAQHCYGFESTVLVALAAGATLTASRPFFPADIAAELESLPRPRGLVTTPYHLRTVLDAGLALPPIDLLLCATAPLTPALANAAEQAFRAPLLEIYGATESGQLAMRRTTREQHWTPYAGRARDAARRPRLGRRRARADTDAARRPDRARGRGRIRVARPRGRYGQHRRQAQFARLPDAGAVARARRASTARSSFQRRRRTARTSRALPRRSSRRASRRAR